MNQCGFESFAKNALYAENFLRNNTSASTLPIDSYELNASASGTHVTKLANVVFFNELNPQHSILSPILNSFLVSAASPNKVVLPFEVAQSTAFEDLAKVRADDRNFLKVLRSLRNSELILEKEVLAERLTVLLHDYQDDYGQSLDAESLNTFIAFVSFHPELKRPIITATPDGNLFAEWKGDEGRRYLGVQFLPTRQVRYVAIRPNPQHPQLRIRTSGIVTTDQLLAEISIHNVSDWANRTK